MARSLRSAQARKWCVTSSARAGRRHHRQDHLGLRQGLQRRHLRQRSEGRYVCEARIDKMLDHEYNLIEERITREDHPTKQYFAFADTVATINYHKTIQGHGWFGIRSKRPQRASPAKSSCTRAPRVRPCFNSRRHARGEPYLRAFYFYKRPKEVLQSLYDNLDRDQLEIDMVQMNGPAFADVDNRLLSLQLVKQGMTDAAVFSPDGRNRQAADVLYKKNILAIRGSFRPVTKVNIDMIAKGLAMFKQETRSTRTTFRCCSKSP